MREAGPLLASGRDSDIFDYGPGLVLRRSRGGRSIAAEARIMDHVRANGYPVPAISEISDDGTELAMERIDGPLMVGALSRRPWTLKQQGEALSGLHDRLHEIPAPDWLAPGPGSPGGCVIHLDLHPLNVILSERGPVVIDWSNATSGLGATDVAVTWVLLASGEIPGGRLKAATLGRFRSAFVHAFLGHFDLDAVRHALPAAVAWKLQDANMSASEQQTMRRLLDTNRGSAEDDD